MVQINSPPFEGQLIPSSPALLGDRVRPSPFPIECTVVTIERSLIIEPEM